jgi:hypothetical protein
MDFLHLIVVPQLSGGWRHKYSTKTRQTGCVHEQSMYSLMSMASATDYLLALAPLSDTTKSRVDPITSVTSYKVAKVTKASRHVSLLLSH